MFQRVQIKNIGPHEDLDIELNKVGQTTIVGRSESGKTTIIEAICFALWGTGADGKDFDKQRLRGAPSVTLTTRSGTIIHRSRDPEKKTVTRTLTKNGEPVSYENENEWLAALGPLGKPALRMALVPMSWVELVNGPGEGRPFRDFLISILPSGDLRAEVAALMKEAGFELQASDVIKASDAESNRKSEKSLLERAIGALGQAEAAAEMGDPGPAPEKPIQAEKTIQAWETWQKYGVERAKYDSINNIEEPESVSDEKLEELRARFEDQKRLADLKRDAEFSLRTFPQVHPEQFRAESEAARLEKELTAAEAADDTCPTCKRDGWSGAAHAVDDLRLRRDAAIAYAADLKQVHEAKRSKLSKAIEECGFDPEQYRETESALASAIMTWKAYQSYLSAKKTLPKEPDPPPVAAPTQEAFDLAKEEINAYHKRAGAVLEFTKRKEQAKKAVEKASKEVTEARSAVERAEALVVACRNAPSNIAKRQEEAIGDLGPIKFNYLSKGGIEVLIDGRPWWLASTGRRIYADAVLRLALRRVMGSNWLPLFVDEIQSWTGELPEIPNGVLLKTADCDLGVAT